jgi:hypothetical protein
MRDTLHVEVPQMAHATAVRINISLTEKDLLKIQEIKEKQNIQSTAAAIRWAINEVLK